MKNPKVILFTMVPAHSHLISTFKLAKKFKEEGYEIKYASDSTNRELIESEGFGCIDLFCNLLPTITDELADHHNNLLRLFFSNMISGKKRLREITMFIDEYRKQIKLLQPEMIFIDSYNAKNSLFLYDISSKVVILNTQLISRNAAGIPPINSNFIPGNSLFINQLISQLLWLSHSVSRLFQKLLQKLIFFGQDNHAIIKKLVPSEQRKQLIFKNTYYPIVKGDLEISLIPQKFDFRATGLGHNHNISMVQQYRNSKTDSAYKLIKEKITTLKGNTQWPLVYCCLGTLSTFHSSFSFRFLKKLIRAFEGEKRILLISTGNSQSTNALLAVAQHYPNVFISRYLPQLEVLSYTDMMINHGGINSIMECIAQSVPMLVYPLNSHYDQRGNAARVTYHGLGQRGNIRADSGNSIKRKIDKILYSPSYKNAIVAFNKEHSYDFDLNDFLAPINGPILQQDVYELSSL